MSTTDTTEDYMNGTKDFKTEDQAIAYLTATFTDDGPVEIRTYVQMLRAEMVEDGENPDLWWAGCSGDDMVEWLFNNL